MITAELQASYRSLRKNAHRMLHAAGMPLDTSSEFAYAKEDEEMMALREYDIKTFLGSDVPEIKKMWKECEAQARLLDVLINDIYTEPLPFSIEN